MTMATTRELYLENFDTKSEAEIAGLAGVSRQRIHQIERKLRVCNMAYVKPGTGHTRVERRTCPVCGNKCKEPENIFCSRKCWRIVHNQVCICAQCHKVFAHRKSDYVFRHAHGQRHFFCHRECFNKWRVGKPRRYKGVTV